MKSRKSLAKVPKEQVVAVVAGRCKAMCDSYYSAMKSLEHALVLTTGSEAYAADPFRLSRLVEELETLPSFGSGDGLKELEALREWCDREKEKIEREFDLQVKSICSRLQVPFDGRYPRYVISGFLVLEAKAKDGACLISRNKVPTLFAPVIEAEIRSQLTAEANRVFVAEVFLDDLLIAYRRVLALKSLAEESSIGLRDIFAELVFVRQSPRFRNAPTRENFMSYTEELFARDLAKLVASGRRTTSSENQLVLAPIADAREGIPVRNGDGIQYLGRMAFRKGTSQ